MALPSRPAWGAWIEICRLVAGASLLTSRPAWGAWIEILLYCGVDVCPSVAPRMGRVD